MLRTTTLLLAARWLTGLGPCGAFTAAPVSSSALLLQRPAGTAASTTTSLNLFGLRSNKKSKLSTIGDDEVRGLFHLWNDALATGNSKIVAKRYAMDPVLLPTVSDKPRTDYDSIKDYFDTFLLNKPQGTILEGYIKSGENWAQDHGIYEFVMGATGDKVKARYSFVYVKENGEWRIQHHHSSILPESIVALAKPISEQQVKNLFYLWNDALATLDAQTVTDRYSKSAVLLPTVSDVARTTPALIKDYFVTFLKLKPQGKILESHVMIGTNWCQDAGIYEFVMGATGAVVRARYTFLYVYEDGAWKIAHHHSSQMPEEMAAKINQAGNAKTASAGPTLAKPEVRKLFKLWNDALATGNPKTVAARYAREAILLPTVSDTPRKTKNAIEEYFVDFLKNKPQGVIVDGVILSGEGWANDAGVYEFTMGATGDKVLARYSFSYAFEDGEWKISHHHSSAMPEDLLAANARVKEMDSKRVVKA